jgi:type II secretion system protein H
LIELMVVIGLIAIMTAMILPEMKGTYEDALLRSTARKLVNVFQLASSQAVAVNQLHRVRFDRKEGQYFLERKSREPAQRGGFAPAGNLPGSQGKLDTRISIELRRESDQSSDSADEAPPPAAEDEARGPSREEAIAFYPDGTADAAEIVLRDREGFRIGLRVNPTTGRVSIVELDRQQSSDRRI